LNSVFEDISFGRLSLRGDRPFLVAEAGVNHENDLDVALKMISEAALAGADAIKFQSYKAERLASKHSPSYWDLSAEPTRSQYELFKKYDHFGEDSYRRLADHAQSCGITFLSTPFDHDFVDALAPLMPAYKIASADLTNYPLLRHCASKSKPMILSVGASTLSEVESAVAEVRQTSDAPIALLHCVLSYPCKPEDANLRIISTLKGRFPSCVIGYSDHVPPSYGCLSLIGAWLLGGRILEKHFTLDKSKPGNDHYHAMDPDDVRRFREQCDYVTATLGDGAKEVLACEQDARKNARRSLVAARPITRGEVVTEEAITVKRPGTGIPPTELTRVLGRPTLCDIAEDEVLQWNMLQERT
jgi:sialic acid synthase SpsE